MEVYVVHQISRLTNEYVSFIEVEAKSYDEAINEAKKYYKNTDKYYYIAELG